jgi:RNA polymerase sigma-70 factor, ECF subfamily
MNNFANDAQHLIVVKQFLAAPDELKTSEQRTAWRDFYHVCDPVILGILRGCDKHWDRIDDLHQEVWVTLIRRLPKSRLDPAQGTLLEWVAGVARRLALRHACRRLRHRDEELTLKLAETLLDDGGAESAADERTLRQERARAVVEQLAADLPEPSRMVVIMHWIDGRAVADIARELGVTEGRAWGILGRFRTALGDFLRLHGWNSLEEF